MGHPKTMGWANRLKTSTISVLETKFHRGQLPWPRVGAEHRTAVAKDLHEPRQLRGHSPHFLINLGSFFQNFDILKKMIHVFKKGHLMNHGLTFLEKQNKQLCPALRLSRQRERHGDLGAESPNCCATRASKCSLENHGIAQLLQSNWRF